MPILPLTGVCSSSLQYNVSDDGRVTGIRFAGGLSRQPRTVSRLVKAPRPGT